MRWPDWFFYQIPDTLAGVAMIVVSCILVIWGVALILSAPAKKSFPFSLGIFMLADATIYALIGIVMLQTEEGIDLWTHSYLLLISITAIVAFAMWGRDHMPGGQDDS